MLLRTIPSAGIALATALAWGQAVAPQSEVFPLSYSDSLKAAEELATTIRTMGQLQLPVVAVSQSSLSVGGTADQRALARWMIGELDQPAIAPLPARPGEHQYRLQDGTGEVVFILYLAHSDSPQNVLEVMTAIRTIADFRFAYPYHERKALAVRGTPEQLRLMEWVAGELDRPADVPPPPNSDARRYRLQDGTGDVVRVSHLAHSATPQNLQAVMVLIRTLTDLRRVFPVMSRNAVSWRGTADQIRLVDWLVGELDQPAASPLPPNTVEHQTGVKDGSEEVVRVFHPPQARTARDLQEVMTLIRNVTDIRRVYPYQARKVLGFRGTEQQIQIAEWIVNTLALSPGSGPQLMAAGNEQVGVFFVPAARTTQELQDLFGAVRTATQAGRSFFTEAQKAIVIRGTSDQIATARRMIEQP